jgi:manganese oxidase
MKAGFLVAAVACLGLSVYALPNALLPSWLADDYFRTFGARSYEAAPPPVAPVIPPVDLGTVCPPHMKSWKTARKIEGVSVGRSPDCVPDNPWEVVASVLGTNNVSAATLMQTLYGADTIEKSDDRDGDGDPDLITIRLEIIELNGHSPDMPDVIPQFEIAPGIKPGLWVFAPKTRGMTTINFESSVANRLARLPAPVIRVEQGDEVRLVLENTHYLPHTIHLHGVDHPFETATGAGNDGVPIFSEHATQPGEARTYVFSPRKAGTAFYHCHVQPQSHILMGLQGMFVVEENRPNNRVQTFNIGGGRVRAPSAAVRETYEREYDLHYTDLDEDLNDRIKLYNDPRLVSREVHRKYNIAERAEEFHVLNGRSFPYTLQESLVVVEPDEHIKLRVLNGGATNVSLHLHGHKATATHLDGVALSPEARHQRDVWLFGSAQRLDLDLNTANDGLNSYGPGAWAMHDHKEQGITTAGVNPGGNIGVIVYEDYLDDNGLPKTVTGLESVLPYFDPAYYRGEIPVFAGTDPDNRYSDPAQVGPWTSRAVMFVASLAGVFLFLGLAQWAGRRRS